MRLPSADIDKLMSWDPCEGWSRRRVRETWQRLELPARATAVDFLEASLRAREGGRVDLADDLSWAAHHLIPVGLDLGGRTRMGDVYRDGALGSEDSSEERMEEHDRVMLEMVRAYIR